MLTSENYPYILEKSRLFSESKIWEWQRGYFKNTGVEAWTKDGLPYYVTSSALMGNTYAKLVMTILAGLDCTDCKHVDVLELGAGHGRFSYYFLKSFTELYRHSKAEMPTICYVMSDISEKNIAYWMENPKLQPFVKEGILDFAFFDMKDSDCLQLLNSGRIIAQGDNQQPLIVIANYVFDTVEQELFYCSDCEIFYSTPIVRSHVKRNSEEAAPDMEKIYLEYNYVKMKGEPYEEPYLNRTIRCLAGEYHNSYMMFPFQVLKCLKKLHSFSREGIIVLSADKGNHLMEIKTSHPQMVSHNGSFSFSVDYYILRKFCQDMGGMSFFSDRQPESIDIGCFVMTGPKVDCMGIRSAFEHSFESRNPDIIYGMIQSIKNSDNYVNFKDVINILYLSDFDPDEFLRILNAIYLLLPQIGSAEKKILLCCAGKIWDRYYPMAEGIDLAYELGALLLQMRFYKEALPYFEKAEYADKDSVIQNRLICYYNTGEISKAVSLLHSI